MYPERERERKGKNLIWNGHLSINDITVVRCLGHCLARRYFMQTSGIVRWKESGQSSSISVHYTYTVVLNPVHNSCPEFSFLLYLFIYYHTYRVTLTKFEWLQKDFSVKLVLLPLYDCLITFMTRI